MDMDPAVWATGRKTGRAKNARALEITLKEQKFFPCQQQHPLRPEARRGLIPIVRDLKERGLTAYIRAQKPNGDWRRVQGPPLINEAVVPLHPVVPPHPPLADPGTAAWVTVGDFKDAFFCIPLTEASHI